MSKLDTFIKTATKAQLEDLLQDTRDALQPDAIQWAVLDADEAKSHRAQLLDSKASLQGAMEARLPFSLVDPLALLSH